MFPAVAETGHVADNWPFIQAVMWSKPDPTGPHTLTGILYLNDGRQLQQEGGENVKDEKVRTKEQGKRKRNPGSDSDMG